MKTGTGLVVLALAAGGLVLPAASSGAASSDGVRRALEVRVTPSNEFGVRRPTGVTYSRAQQALVVTSDTGTRRRAVAVRTRGERKGPTTPPALPDDAALKVARDAGSTVGPAGTQYVLDAGKGQVVTVPRGGPGAGRVTRTSIKGVATSGLRGIAYDPASRALYVANPSADRLHRLSGSGTVTATYDLSGTSVSNLQAITFAPTADPTDAPTRTNLFVADSGTRQAGGSLVEVSLTAAATLVAPNLNASHVKTTATSTWPKTSPDPSGVAYIPSENRLAIDDGEIEEATLPPPVGSPPGTPNTAPFWQGSNLFFASLSGGYEASGSTLSYSKEPVGLGFDPGRSMVLVADDDAKRIFVVGKGSDGLYGTAGPDHSFSCTTLGIQDCESVEADPTTGDYWIGDAVGTDVYRLRAGANGRIDGAGDDIVTSFDVGQFGALDPEGLAFDPVRQTVLVLDDPSHAVYELTRGGRLLNVIRIPTGSTREKAAGLALAPASGGGGTHWYVVDRGIDNNTDPTANDGQLIEIAPPPSLSNPVANAAPTVTVGPDQAVRLPAAVTLPGTVTDDGYPDPVALTQTWSATGPGSVTFADPSAASTTATFSQVGTYTLTLTGDDGLTTGSDSLVVTVTQNNPPVTNAGPDLTVEVPDQVKLVGSASDDGLPNPPGTLTVTWSKVSGPGSVSFTAPNAVSTYADFSLPGPYVLRLTGSDSELTGTDDVTVTVTAKAHLFGATTRRTGRADFAILDEIDSRVRHRAWTRTSGLGAGTSLGGREHYAPAIADNGTTLYVFATGSDGRLRYKTRLNGTWSRWRSAGLQATSSPAAVVTETNRVHVFVRGSDGAVWKRSVSAGGTWSAWSRIGGQPRFGTGPAVAYLGSGRFELVVHGPRDDAYRSTKVNGRGWTAFTSLGGPIKGTPTATTDRNGMFFLFARGADDRIYLKTITTTRVNPWRDLGGAAATGPVAVAVRGSNVLDVFVYGKGGLLNRKTRTNWTWSGWTRTY